MQNKNSGNSLKVGGSSSASGRNASKSKKSNEFESSPDHANYGSGNRETRGGNSIYLYRYDERNSGGYSPNAVPPLTNNLSKKEIVRMRNIDVSDNDISPIISVEDHNDKGKIMNQSGVYSKRFTNNYNASETPGGVKPYKIRESLQSPN